MSVVIDRNELLSLRSDFEIRQFQELIADNEKRAYTMALQLTRNPSEAQDLMQDTFVKAWRGFDSYMPGRPFLNWLLRIMQRAYLDNRRRENPIRKAESLNSMVSPNDGEIQELPIPDLGPTPDEELIQAEFRAELSAALEELPPVYRQSIVMCDIENLSYSEIADVQHTTVGTVRSRIHRGRKLLREVLVKRGVANRFSE